ncbi:hypothetical protein [Butyrivibrio sp. MC2013]|uniref:hypothetical protein n=1 Tax=Butyrivibrio sp. MC2013 TaxID=1280686 RepID=UPI00047DB484|nr:hypothetical protein [Butyrivibrio sp. MC2013]
MENNKVVRCKQCGKILISESKMGLCPKCADKDLRSGAEVLGILGLGAIGIKNLGSQYSDF